MTAITLDGLDAYFSSLDAVTPSLDDAIWETGNANMSAEYRFGTHEKAVRESQFKGWIANRGIHVPDAVNPRSQRLSAGPQLANYSQSNGYAGIWPSPSVLLNPATNAIWNAQFRWGTHAAAVYEAQFRGKILSTIPQSARPFLSISFIADGQAYRDSPSAIYGRAHLAPPAIAPRIIRVTGRPPEDPTQIPARLFKMLPDGAQSPPIARFKAIVQELPWRNDSFVQTKGKFVGGIDIVPDQFTFVDQTGVPISGVITSAAVTITGINSPSPITVVGGEYSINGGAFTTLPGVINAGDQVVARHTSSASFLSDTNTTVAIGGVFDVFTSTTVADSAEDLRVIVPYLIGDTLQAAIQHLASVYLLYAVNGTTEGTVTAQDIAHMTLVARHTTVTITLGGAFNFSNRRKQQHGLPIFGSPED